MFFTGLDVADGDSCMSVREVLRTKRAHCIESALIAALAFWIHGERPLIMDFSANDADDDHVIVLFKQEGGWGGNLKRQSCVHPLPRPGVSYPP